MQVLFHFPNLITETHIVVQSHEHTHTFQPHMYTPTMYTYIHIHLSTGSDFRIQIKTKLRKDEITFLLSLQNGSPRKRQDSRKK